MGNDVKIGLVVGAVVLLVVAGYFGYKAAHPADSDTQTPQVSDKSDEQAASKVTLKSENGQVRSATPDRPVRPARRTPTDTRTPVPAPAAFASSRPAGRIVSSGKPPTDSTVKAVSSSTKAPAKAVVPPRIPANLPVVSKPVVARVAEVDTKETTARSPYTVKEGDSYWSIAQEVYGDGKYMNLIALANPKAKAKQLRAGQHLVIPPLPRTAERSSPVTANRTLPAGYSEYTVVEGEQGFWSVAKNVYGSGIHWPLIQKANRDVDSHKLQPGQKLLVPPLKSTGKDISAVVSTERPATTRTPKAGVVYTVKDGDTLWKIAERVYGDGKHMDLIAGANPGIDRDNLKPGQKINLPSGPRATADSLPPARRPAPVETASDGKPVFD